MAAGRGCTISDDEGAGRALASCRERWIRWIFDKRPVLRYLDPSIQEGQGLYVPALPDVAVTGTADALEIGAKVPRLSDVPLELSIACVVAEREVRAAVVARVLADVPRDEEGRQQRVTIRVR